MMTLQSLCSCVVDGVSNVLPQQTLPQAKKAKRAGIQIFGVGIELKPAAELRRIVSDKDHITLLPSYDHLLNSSEEFLGQLCKPLGNEIPLLADDPDLGLDGNVPYVY